MTDARCPATLELSLGPITAVDLALYAAASGDLNPLHLDADTAHAAGFERPIAHGMPAMACAGGPFPDPFGATPPRNPQTPFLGTAQIRDSPVRRTPPSTA